MRKSVAVIKRITVIDGPEVPGLQRSLFEGEAIPFTLSDGTSVTLHISTVYRGLGGDGVRYYLIAFPRSEDSTSDEDRYFFIYDPGQQKGEGVWYTAEELDRLPHYVYYTPDYWAVAMKQTPSFR